MKAEQLRLQADQLFERRQLLLGLWQEEAENFYPERADFTVKRYLNNDFAGNLMSSFPVLCRRDLQDSIATMLRDTRNPWFAATTTTVKTNRDNDVRACLEWMSQTMRNAMYDPVAMFDRAMKQDDGDFSCFGNSVSQVRLNKQSSSLLFACHHLRDVVWMEDENQQICFIARRWKPYARDLVNCFDKNKLHPGNSVSPKVVRLADKEPFTRVECLHIMCVADMYDGDAGKGIAAKPWRSIYYDTLNKHEMESVAQWNKEYVISRWQMVSGVQYATSPAVIAALPDARLLQSMTYTLLTAGEKMTNPPMIGTEQAVRSDVDITSGGITWISYEYDERMGEALRPITMDTRGMPIGKDMMMDCRGMLQKAFYLDKIKPFVPTTDPSMTAFQAGQIVAQYIRDALPLFQPMEAEKNGGICEEIFNCMLRAGGFGNPANWPQKLQGADVHFQFQSPLHEAIDSQKGQKFLQMGQLIAQAMALDHTAGALPNVIVSLRDALQGIGVPARWVNSEGKVSQLVKAMKQQQDVDQKLNTLNTGANVANTLGQAAQTLNVQPRAGAGIGAPG